MAATDILRGVARALADRGCGTLAEVPLPGGRRADLMALTARGEFLIVEVKSCLEDFRADRKWPDYLAWCDRFYFAVDAAFPHSVLPAECGLMVADPYGAAVLREAPLAPLPAPRRRAQLVRFAMLASSRLAMRSDPPL